MAEVAANFATVSFRNPLSGVRLAPEGVRLGDSLESVRQKVAAAGITAEEKEITSADGKAKEGVELCFHASLRIEPMGGTRPVSGAYVFARDRLVNVCLTAVCGSDEELKKDHQTASYHLAQLFGMPSGGPAAAATAIASLTWKDCNACRVVLFARLKEANAAEKDPALAGHPTLHIGIFTPTA